MPRQNLATSAGVLLDQKESWPERLKAGLSPGRVHMDNYARDGSTHQEIKVLLKHLVDNGIRYDIILLMSHLATDTKASEKTAFHYWGQWVNAKPGLLTFPHMLLWQLEEQVSSEKRLNRLVTSISKIFVTPAAHQSPTSRSNKQLRLSGKITLIDVPVSCSEKARQWLERETRELLQAAGNVADRVYLIPQPVAYDEREHPGVSKRWISLYPVSECKECYKSNKSVAEGIRLKNEIMTGAAHEMGGNVIDLDGYLRRLIRERDDLFDDKWHFSPTGAEIAAEVIAEELIPIIEKTSL